MNAEREKQLIAEIDALRENLKWTLERLIKLERVRQAADCVCEEFTIEESKFLSSFMHHLRKCIDQADELPPKTT